MSEQQHTFYCQELGTLLMCLIHIFKSGRCIAPAWLERLCPRPARTPGMQVCAEPALLCPVCI